MVTLLGNKITFFSCPISLAFGFTFYSILLILIYTKVPLHFATVCSSSSCIIQSKFMKDAEIYCLMLR